MTTALALVNQPITLGRLPVRNRIFVAAHSTNFAERLSSERLADYYAERARGGVGLIIHEPVIVHLSSLSRPTKVWGFDRENVAPYRRAADVVHGAGAAFLCQILHNGAHMGATFTDGPLWAPSPTTDPLYGEPAHEMTPGEIAAVIEGFAVSAEVCAEGGFDGVEIHGSHGYLVQQFLSPLTNRRTDDYGGDEERRQRFLFDIVAAVRRRVGADLVVGVRMAGDERAPGGLGPDDAGRLARRLEESGQVDYVNVSTGGAAAPGWIVLDATYERGANLDAAGALKAATSLPVLVAGRIARPEEAEAALAAGAADMVGVVRALIADPAWLTKANADDEAAIRPCTYCNECVAGIGTYRPIACTVNPDMGHEREAARLARATGPARRVVVVGGGVAGMEAAVGAAERGHSVVLLEAEDQLGGQLVGLPPLTYRRELVHLAPALAGALERAGVEVRLGAPANAEAVLALQPDSVVVATGAAPVLPRAEAVDAWAVLSGTALVGHRVLVVHDGGHPWEFDVVLEVLATGGHQVVAAVPGPALVARGTDASLWPRLARAKVELLTGRALVSFAEGRTQLRNVLTGETDEVDSFDHLVVAGTRRACAELAAALEPRVDQVLVVGDALAPRSVRDALCEARAAARRVDGVAARGD